MTTETEYRDRARRSKYQGLYWRLCGLRVTEWSTSFGEIESILGFALPPSARRHRPWWANQRSGNGHSQATAWGAAGWETAEVDMDAETLLLRRKGNGERRPSLDEIFGPPHSVGEWPEGLSLRREDMYDDRMYPASCS